MTMLILVAALVPLLVLGGVIALVVTLIKKQTTMESKTRALDVFVYVGITYHFCN